MPAHPPRIQPLFLGVVFKQDSTRLPPPLQQEELAAEKVFSNAQSLEQMAALKRDMEAGKPPGPKPPPVPKYSARADVLHRILANHGVEPSASLVSALEVWGKK